NGLGTRTLRDGIKLVDKLAFKKVEDFLVVPKDGVLVACEVVKGLGGLGKTFLGTILHTTVEQFLVPRNIEGQVVGLPKGIAKHRSQERTVSKFLAIALFRAEAQTFRNSGAPERRVRRLVEREKIVEAVDSGSILRFAIRTEHSAHLTVRGKELNVLSHEAGIVEVILEVGCSPEVGRNPFVVGGGVFQRDWGNVGLNPFRGRGKHTRFHDRLEIVILAAVIA
ncbi:hypothetical protein C4U94_19475, partial [Clostridioides difficile]